MKKKIKASKFFILLLSIAVLSALIKSYCVTSTTILKVTPITLYTLISINILGFWILFFIGAFNLIMIIIMGKE
ncbi:MAG: hypothetical protein GWP10_22200 [Nitrospiraceae bacterium]|nr:hypothetical protein [Nitrospiraceae bacterium]